MTSPVASRERANDDNSKDIKNDYNSVTVSAVTFDACDRKSANEEC